MSELDTLALMRAAFDEAFALPHVPPGKAGRELLVLRIQEDRLAMPLDELTGLLPPPTIVPLPGAPAALLGLAGIRGQLVPVYDLAALLGRPAAPAVTWLALVDAQQPIAFAFAELEGRLAAPEGALRPLAAGRAPTGVRALLRGDGAPVAILDLAAVAALARQQTSPPIAPGGPPP